MSGYPGLKEENGMDLRVATRDPMVMEIAVASLYRCQAPGRGLQGVTIGGKWIKGTRDLSGLFLTAA